MANDKQQMKPPSDVTVLPPQDTKPVPAEQRGVPVRLVRWERPLQIPGKQQDESIGTKREANGREWLVTYLPRDRHFQIDYKNPNRETENGTAFVHETRALSWEPL